MDPINTFYDQMNSAKPETVDVTFDQTIAQLPKLSGVRLLDIGCWDGSKTVLMAEKLGASEVWGVDFNVSRLAEAERRGVKTKCVDFNTGFPLDIPSEYFDVVFCGEVIEHVFSPDDLMDEITRLLRTGGYAIITTPNLASWKNRLILLLGWQPFYTEVSTRARYGNPRAPRGLPSGHIRMFTPRALSELAYACGLELERIVAVGAPSPEAGLVGKISRFVDTHLLPYRPTLGDRMVVRLRKRANRSSK